MLALRGFDADAVDPPRHRQLNGTASVSDAVGNELGCKDLSVEEGVSPDLVAALLDSSAVNMIIPTTGGAEDEPPTC